ncbi:MAG TPA: long-chain fatty acid--CoA ligase [Candidatus Eisenbacteria bacterium]
MDVKTTPDLLSYARETHRKADAFLVKRAGQWVPISIEAFQGDVERAAGWLRGQGIGRGDRVLLLSESRYEWAVTDLAILSLAAISVPIYPTLPVSQIAPLVRDSGAVAAFVSSQGQREKIEAVQGAGHPLRWIWMFDRDGLPAQEGGGAGGAGGAGAARGAADGPGPDDVATIIYTSGTTGAPKGVMLTHANFVAEVKAATKAMQLREDDVYLSFLPLSHVLERCSGFYTMLWAGVTIAYAESFDRLPYNLREVRPTVILAVPRLYEKVLSRAHETAAGAGRFTRSIFSWAYRVAVEWGRLADERKPVPPWLSLQRAAASTLVYRKIARGMGGRTRIRVSGGAPLNREVGLFYLGAGLPIFEGYGLTETSSAISVNTFERHRVSTVGPLFDGVEARIEPDGEIVVRGPTVMKGYWQKPAETAEALQDGWFHTGDIGEIDAEGLLRITDRKKDLLVTSVGKKVAPQPIEEALKASPRIAEALVVGDGQKYVAALIVPAAGATREAIAEDVERVNGPLAPFEKIKRFELIPNDLTIENGFMTPSLKLKRKAVLDHHRQLVERLFHGA